MSFNTGTFNSKPFNGTAGFTEAVSTAGPVVTIEQEVRALATGVVVTLAQDVGFLSTVAANATLIQVVELLSPSVAGPVITLDQEVAFKSVADPIEINQLVVSSADAGTFFDRNGYEPMLYIGGVAIPVEEIHGEIKCTFTASSAPSLKFMIIPPTGAQDVRKYRGKSVILNIRELSGVTRQFTGKINTPDVQIIQQKIAFNCSLDMEQVVESKMTRSALNQIGLYNNEVFSKPETKLQELNDRLSTIPKELNFRKNGVPAVDNIASAGSATVTLADASVYRDGISFKFGSGQRYINRVNLTVDYTYERLHHHERQCAAGVDYDTVCEMLDFNYSILMRSMVAGAVQGSDWPLKRGGIAYSPIFEAGWYQCAAPGTGQGPIGWTTLSCTGTTQTVLDANGKPVQIDGEDQLEVINAACTDYGPLMCRGAGWWSTTRFAQSVKSNYTITVEAPQSISNNGLKERDTSFSLSSNFNTEEWEDYDSYTTSIPTGLSVSGTSATNYWINETTKKSAFNTSLNIMLNKAKSDILKSHREDKVIFKRSLWTALEMWYTVRLDTDKVDTTGRVFTYTHSMNPKTGEAYTTVELALSQAGIGAGSVTGEALTLPSILTSTPAYPTSVLALGAHYGQDPSQAGAENWTGHIGNKRLRGEFFTTNYPESFVFDTPDIGDNLRKTQDLNTTVSYDVDIPDDPLNITFDE